MLPASTAGGSPRRPSRALADWNGVNCTAARLKAVSTFPEPSTIRRLDRWDSTARPARTPPLTDAASLGCAGAITSNVAEDVAASARSEVISWTPSASRTAGIRTTLTGRDEVSTARAGAAVKHVARTVRATASGSHDRYHDESWFVGLTSDKSAPAPV